MTQTSDIRNPAPRRMSLRRMLLSLGVAAAIAAWLPFSIMYMNAAARHAVAVATTTVSPRALTAGTSSSSTRAVPVRTTASGAVVAATPTTAGSSVTATAGTPVTQVTPISTHAS